MAATTVAEMELREAAAYVALRRKALRAAAASTMPPLRTLAASALDEKFLTEPMMACLIDSLMFGVLVREDARVARSESRRAAMPAT